METAVQPAAVDAGALFREHGAFLYRVVQRMTGAGPHVDDIIQHVFLTAHTNRARLPEPALHRAWLTRVALNHLQHHRRGFARITRLLEGLKAQPITAATVDPHGAAEDSQQAQWIRACTARLPEKLRAVFILHELEDVDVADIAAMLDIPPNTARSRLRLARESFEREALRTRPRGEA
jgi:RNA polymerase sigma-70 factor (ECF subfamily)